MERDAPLLAPCRRPILIATKYMLFRDRTLVHRVTSRRHTAVGQLVDFQGANDEHISIDT
jgi:hypothetical protein